LTARETLRLVIALPLLLVGCDADTLAPAPGDGITAPAMSTAQAGHPVPNLTAAGWAAASSASSGSSR
jgi:hypothetical protein